MPDHDYLREDERDADRRVFYTPKYPPDASGCPVGEWVSAEDYQRALSRLSDARRVLAEWAKYNDDHCRFDHHGYCQAHYLEQGTNCIVARTNAALEGVER